ncbi:hypothetical protein O4H52_16865 [Sphingomonadaceae bacterium G21617-S1]|nr:hypothetical protein [Sphingomonadaceae bacterium G21617-S1]
MIKVISYVLSDNSKPAGLLGSEYTDKFLPSLLSATPEIVGCTANVLNQDLAGGLPGDKMDAEQPSSAHSYEAAIEYWIESTADRMAGVLDAIEDSPGGQHSYWVRELVAKDTVEATEKPYLRLISPCLPKTRMPLPQVFQFWCEHVEKANRIHIGMSRYIRNWHEQPLTAGAPAYFGAPMLNFQSQEDWLERFYVDEAGAEEIAADVGSFVDSFTPLLAREVRIKEI